MAAEENIRTLFDNTHAAYLTCWRTLADMKGGNTSDDYRDGLLLFQPTLATAICDLDRANRGLEQDREDLVKRKATLPREQFLSDIKRQGKYQEAIGEAIQLGKTLGDAFVWFFYHDELPVLFKHLEHEPVTEVPTGVGHAGEMAFINDVKVVDGHFVLYHGITTILRHGDVSLIDLDTFKLTCLGELKSRDADGGGIEVLAHFVNPKDRPLPQTFRNAPRLKQPRPALPPQMEERFRRQIQGMGGAFKPIPFQEHIRLEQDTHFPALMALANELEHSEVAYRRCGDGLLLAGFRTDEATSLFDKLIGGKLDATAKIQGLPQHVLQVMDTSPANATDNSLIISGIGKSTLPGATPIFWSPLTTAFLQKLLFDDVVVVSIYNPAHLIRKLREQGFEVDALPNRQYDIYKTVHGNRMSLQGFDYFLRLIQEHLVSERVVLDILSHIHDAIDSGRVGVNTRIPLYLLQQLQAPGPD